MTALTQRSELLRWLPCFGVVPLSADAALVGHDSWADGRFGDYAGSRVMLNDYIRIRELAWLDPATRLARLNALGDEAAEYLRGVLPKALERFERVIVLTHVPPFEEACWHQGRISDKDHLPHFLELPTAASPSALRKEMSKVEPRGPALPRARGPREAGARSPHRAARSHPHPNAA